MEYKVGDIVSGKVTGIKDYGVFISLNNYFSGLIHISEISVDFVRNIQDFCKIGDTINVKILDIDNETSQMKLSIKNIDYIIKNNKRKIIKQTGTGFEKLKFNFQKWIDKKITEMV